MLQYSKVLLGRDEWKAKAIARGDDLREQRKTLSRYRQQVAALKAEVKTLRATVSEADLHAQKN